MIAKTYTCSLLGIDAILVEVEVDLASGLPGFSTVGLPDSIVKESKDRVKAAIQNSGYPFPFERITVNLAPAALRKEGAGFDLPIAVGLLAAEGIVDAAKAAKMIFCGELALDGRVKPVDGCLSMAIQARDAGYADFVLPAANAREAAVLNAVSVRPVNHLAEVVEYLNGRTDLPAFRCDIDSLWNESACEEFDFEDVKGQEHAKRGLEVAASGSHNVLLIGPPGSGKTMLAQRVFGILPPLSFDEALETSKVFSVAGQLSNSSLVVKRPFRSPHHTISDAGLVGGGHIPKPGEVSLAHNGVLFLDEFPEFRRNVVDLLRQPLEDGQVTIARAAMALTYPAKSAAVRERVSLAREVQLKRFSGEGIYSNSQMRPKHLKKFCRLDASGQGVLDHAVQQLGLSARAYHRLLKVARTIADLDGKKDIVRDHLFEAIQYRTLDRKMF
jgi:magnesium chelatase family protein